MPVLNRTFIFRRFLARPALVWFAGRNDFGKSSLETVSIKAERFRFAVASLRGEAVSIEREINSTDVTRPNHDVTVCLH